MRCAGAPGACLRMVKPGNQAARRVEFWRQDNGELLVYSDGVPGAAGKLSEAAGKLEAAQHFKCYWAEVKKLRPERQSFRAPAAAPLPDPAHQPASEDWRQPVTVNVEEMLNPNAGERGN